MPVYQLTRRLLQQALEQSGVLPSGARVVLQEGSPDDPVLAVQYVVAADAEAAGPLGEIHTFGDARAFVLAHRDKGVICPCCDRYVRVYRRKLNSGMATAFARLVQIYLLQERRPVHAEEICEPTKNRDFSQLRFWGLMEELPKTEVQRGRTSGFWIPTERGVSFAQGRLAVPRYRIHASGDEATMGWSPETTTIREALPEGFSYDELMSSSRREG